MEKSVIDPAMLGYQGTLEDVKKNTGYVKKPTQDSTD